jgi:uncharacterized protein YceH (UPF0502 family)
MLNPIEVRILGALLEKEVTTPEYYPLTLNALTRACNQKSNREPVVDFDENTVLQALAGLTFDKDLAKRVISDDSRVPKYRHALTEKLHLTRPEAATLCVLMLRGPQTLGEIRGRTERLYDFDHVEAVETTLQGLMERASGPLVTKLPRQPGRKEADTHPALRRRCPGGRRRSGTSRPRGTGRKRPPGGSGARSYGISGGTCGSQTGVYGVQKTI